MNQLYRKSAPAIAVFLLVNAFVFIFKRFLQSNGFGLRFLLVANLILFLLGLAGFVIQMKALGSHNTNAFLRGIYASLLLKVFVVIIALALYLFITHGKINKPSLFTSLALYIVYTLLEVRQLMKIARKKPDA